MCTVYTVYLRLVASLSIANELVVYVGIIIHIIETGVRSDERRVVYECSSWW